jgi:glutathione synthase/RimK-type ligase-like ATP-grasp enzyme
VSLDVVVVMDGPETVAPATDTSFGLVVAAGERGHRCWHCGPGDLSVVDGTVRANVLRRPTGADFRANICVGGAVELVDLDAADHRIVAAVAPALRADGLAFVGIDVVDGHLTEVNVTSPTGLRQRCDLSGERPDLQIVRWLEDRAGQPGSSQPPDDVVCEDSVDG